MKNINPALLIMAVIFTCCGEKDNLPQDPMDTGNLKYIKTMEYSLQTDRPGESSYTVKQDFAYDDNMDVTGITESYSYNGNSPTLNQITFDRSDPEKMSISAKSGSTKVWVTFDDKGRVTKVQQTNKTAYDSFQYNKEGRLSLIDYDCGPDGNNVGGNSLLYKNGMLSRIESNDGGSSSGKDAVLLYPGKISSGKTNLDLNSLFLNYFEPLRADFTSILLLVRGFGRFCDYLIEDMDLDVEEEENERPQVEGKPGDTFTNTVTQELPYPFAKQPHVGWTLSDGLPVSFTMKRLYDVSENTYTYKLNNTVASSYVDNDGTVHKSYYADIVNVSSKHIQDHTLTINVTVTYL